MKTLDRIVSTPNGIASLVIDQFESTQEAVDTIGEAEALKAINYVQEQKKITSFRESVQATPRRYR